MSDISLEPVGGCFDIVIDNGDLKADNGLETAVAISVFSDRRVSEDDLPILEKGKRGWWGDLFPEEPNDQIGSRLWLIFREKRTVETLKKSEDYISEALEWMIEDGVTNSIDVNSSYVNGQLISLIDILRPSGASERFQMLWQEQTIRRA